MVIGHKQGNDGDRNTWVPSVRISGCGFTAGKSALFQGTITSLCKLFRHKKRFTLKLDQPTNTNRDASCLLSSFPI